MISVTRSPRHGLGRRSVGQGLLHKSEGAPAPHQRQAQCGTCSLPPVLGWRECRWPMRFLGFSRFCSSPWSGAGFQICATKSRFRKILEICTLGHLTHRAIVQPPDRFFISCAGSLDYTKLCSVYRYGVFVIPNTVHDAFSHLLLTELVTASLFYAPPKEETSENSGNVASQEGACLAVCAKSQTQCQYLGEGAGSAE